MGLFMVDYKIIGLSDILFVVPFTMQVLGLENFCNSYGNTREDYKCSITFRVKQCAHQ